MCWQARVSGQLQAWQRQQQMLTTGQPRQGEVRRVQQQMQGLGLGLGLVQALLAVQPVA